MFAGAWSFVDLVSEDLLRRLTQLNSFDAVATVRMRMHNRSL
jgi:hypothetical protein